MKKVKYISIFLIGVLLLSVIIFLINKNYKTKVDKDENVVNSNEKENKRRVFNINIQNDGLYVDNYEKEYTNYSRKTKVYENDFYNNEEYNDGPYYYIENGTVKYMDVDNNDSYYINIQNEKAKYLTNSYTRCDNTNGAIFILTEEGNVYATNIYGSTSKAGKDYLNGDAKLVYSGGNAKEIISFYESNVLNTCAKKSTYILINNNLYLLQLDGSLQTREVYHPYSTHFNEFGIGPGFQNILLYPDSSINKYLYDVDSEYVNEFLTDKQGNKIIVSYIYFLNDNFYVIDTSGVIYHILLPQNNNEDNNDNAIILDEDFISLNKVKSLDGIITYLEHEALYDLTITYIDGKVEKYSTSNGDILYFLPPSW